MKNYLEQLVKIAQKNGYITYDAINDILPAEAIDPEEVEKIIEFLEENNISLVEEEELKKEKELGKEEELVKKEEGISREPVTAYLQEIGAYSLLTQEREQELTKRIRKGYNTIMSLILHSKLNYPEIQKLKLQVQEWRRKDIAPKRKHLDTVVKIITDLSKKYQDPDLKKLAQRIKRLEHKVRIARDEMIGANLRLVVSIAKRYVGQGQSF